MIWTRTKQVGPICNYIYIEATYSKSIGQEKEKQHYISALGTVRMFIEPSTQALTITRLTHAPYTTEIARVRC